MNHDPKSPPSSDPPTGLPSRSLLGLPASGETALPPGQQMAALEKWPVVGERTPALAAGTWVVELRGLIERPIQWTLDQISERPQTEFLVDVHCVTRWSKPAMRFSGVPLLDLLLEAGPLPETRFVRFTSHSQRGHDTSLSWHDVQSLKPIVALRHDGLPLTAEHGGPVRIVTPGKYFYKSIKWLSGVELRADDRLGYWEAQAGYHNQADPWLEQRFLASKLSLRETARLIASRDLTGLDLLGFTAADRDLSGLLASGALLRNADFRRAVLTDADFRQANLSNACFVDADLRRASFHSADLEGAEFTGADLRGADLTGSSLFGASFTSPTSSRPALLDPSTRLPPRLSDVLTPDQLAFLHRFPWFESS